MNLQQLSDEEFAELKQTLFYEDARRSTLTNGVQEQDSILDTHRRATGDGPGCSWVQPSSAITAYPKGWQVTHNGKTWESSTPGNLHEPGSGNTWTEVAG